MPRRASSDPRVAHRRTRPGFLPGRPRAAVRSGVVVASSLVLIATSPQRASGQSAAFAADATMEGRQERVEVRSVEFRGARAITRSELLSVTVVQPTRCRSPIFALFCALGADWALDRRFLPDEAELRRDTERIVALYRAGGYPSATAEVSVARRDGVAGVTFDIVEGTPVRVRSVTVLGIDTLMPPLSLPPLPLEPGQPYGSARIEATEQLLLDVLAEHARPYAAIEFGGDVDEAAGTADVVITVVPGPTAVFGEPRITVADPLTERVVRERLAFEPGEPFRTSGLAETERALEALPIVSAASATAVAQPGSPVITPDVVVRTGRRRALQGEGTVSSVNCLELGGAWRDRWFAGGPRVLTLALSFSNLFAGQVGGTFPCTSAGTGPYARANYRASVDLWQPMGDATALQATGFAHRFASPNVYVQEGFGGSASVSHEPAPGTTLRAGIAPERSTLNAVSLYFCAGFGLCTPQEAEPFTDPRWLVPVQVVAERLSPGALLVVRPPPRGAAFTAPPLPRLRHRVRVMGEGGASFTGSDYSFARSVAEASVTRVLGRDIELAGRVRGGIVTGDTVLPPQLRLYSGGVVTVRGAEQNLVGPQVLLMDADRIPADCTPPCDLGTIDPDAVRPRPTGGDRLFEANVEMRVWLADRVQLAAFADYGVLARSDARSFTPGPDSEALFSPGVGLRIVTGLGPLRIDVAYGTRGARTYPVFSDAGDGTIIQVGTARYDPYGRDGATGLRAFVRRLQLHLGVGQPF